MVPVVPNLVFKEFIVALVLLAVIFSFGALFNAPLLEKANPTFSLNPTKAPWYFAGVQELLMHFHPFVAAFILPACVVCFLAALPYLKYEEEPNGVWFISESGKRSSISTAKFAALLTIFGIILNEYILDLEILLRPLPGFVSNGIIPLLLLMLAMYAFYRFNLKKQQLTKTELVQAIFVFIVACFIVLTLTGIFFRGKDMELSLPWNVLML
jgi:hypothetical protein